MLNSRKYTAVAVLGVGLAVAAATPAPAKAYWLGWGGRYYGCAGWPAAYGFARVHRFGYGCGCPRAYGAYFPRYRSYRPYAYAGYFPRYRFYRPFYAYAGYRPMFRYYRPIYAYGAYFPRHRFYRVARFWQLDHHTRRRKTARINDRQRAMWLPLYSFRRSVDPGRP